MIYLGAILPILSHGAPVWIEILQRKSNVTKIRRFQRLTKTKIVKAYSTPSYEALCMLTGITSIVIELENEAQLYHVTRGKNQDGFYDAPTNYRGWTHPAEAIELKNK